MKDNKKYYKDIKRLFPIHGKKEKNYLKNIKEQINEYDNVSYSDLEKEFGTPIEITKSYYDTIDSSYLLKRINIKRSINFFCIISLLIFILYLGYKIHVLNQAYEDFASGIPTEIQEIIEK